MNYIYEIGDKVRPTKGGQQSSDPCIANGSISSDYADSLSQGIITHRDSFHGKNWYYAPDMSDNWFSEDGIVLMESGASRFAMVTQSSFYGIVGLFGKQITILTGHTFIANGNNYQWSAPLLGCDLISNEQLIATPSNNTKSNKKVKPNAIDALEKARQDYPAGTVFNSAYDNSSKYTVESPAAYRSDIEGDVEVHTIHGWVYLCYNYNWTVLLINSTQLVKEANKKYPKGTLIKSNVSNKTFIIGKGPFYMMDDGSISAPIEGSTARVMVRNSEKWVDIVKEDMNEILERCISMYPRGTVFNNDKLLDAVDLPNGRRDANCTVRDSHRIIKEENGKHHITVEVSVGGNNEGGRTIYCKGEYAEIILLDSSKSTSNKIQVFPGIFIGDIVVSLEEIEDRRDIGDMFEVLAGSSNNSLQYEAIHGRKCSSINKEEWRLADSYEITAFLEGANSIDEVWGNKSNPAFEKIEKSVMELAPDKPEPLMMHKHINIPSARRALPEQPAYLRKEVPIVRKRILY